MLPVIAIVGRPNVGKSTFFNYVTRSRDALVLDIPGVTRDRHYGHGKVGSKPYLIIDTAGLTTVEEGIEKATAVQAYQAIEEAEMILFMLDARVGIMPADQKIAANLRGLNKKVVVIANKIDGVNPDVALAEFYQLGFGAPHPLAAVQGRGAVGLMDWVCEQLIDPSEITAAPSGGIKVAIVGRPNVGKSTLINRMLGENRLVVYDQPGTTRDSIFLPLQRHGKNYTLIDTAGVRRRSRIELVLEKFSVVKTLQAIETANVVIILLDAQAGLSSQDLSLLGFIVEAGKSLVIAVNKWDDLAAEKKVDIKTELSYRLKFADFAKIYFISALHGTGVGHLYEAVDEAYECAMRELATPMLTRLLEQAIDEWQPPLAKGRRIKLRYAHSGGHNPPIIVIHGNQTEAIPAHYRRYLVNYFHQALKMVGTPVTITFKSSDNPFKDKRDLATPLQKYKQQRDKKRLVYNKAAVTSKVKSASRSKTTATKVGKVKTRPVTFKQPGRRMPMRKQPR